VRTTLPHHPSLDGIRGLAVTAVLLFHGGVAGVAGGFLGVDAFFVLSGFLITALLAQEHHDTGGVALRAFWGRRARRLLPALLLMLAVVLPVSRWLLPAEELAALRIDALTAVGYVANWRFADRGGGYFAETAAPSPLQHTWSLAIEEQFYLVWPLLVVLLFAATRTLTAHRRRALMVGACLGGAVASTVTAAVLSATADADRVYYGTDTRAAALLVGCGLALGLAGREPVARPSRLLGALAIIGATATAGLWITADGADPWLYRGGLLVAALAVAAVIAHTVRSPGARMARLLGTGPLARLGVVSYGVYLWHWPLFGWLNAERTGLDAAPLFALRCAATLAAASISYLCVERPVRRSTWLRRPLLTPATAATAMAAVATVAVFVTMPPAIAPIPPVDLDQAMSRAMAPAVSPAPTRSAAATRRPAPVDRRGRRPGKLPRVAFFGDSVSWSLGTYLPEQQHLAVTVRGVPGCGIARLPDIRYIGTPHTNYPGCDTWDRRWRRGVQKDDPDVAVVLLDRWELMDRRLGGRYQHIGDPAFDAYLNRELDLALDIVAGRGAHIVVLTAPYTRRAERPDGGLWPEDMPARVDAWNSLLRAAATRHDATVIDLNARVCPGGKFAWRAGGVRVRSDGLHFTPEGVRRHIAPWLLPQLATLAVHPRPPATVDTGP
jgi:peptidoglycan/LPS O-acetylase OafA/YrhL